MRRRLPSSQPQKAAAAARGKATVLAPTWSGTMAVPSPTKSGSRKQKTAATAWKDSTCAATSSPSTWSSSVWMRSTATSSPATPAATRNTSDHTT